MKAVEKIPYHILIREAVCLKYYFEIIVAVCKRRKDSDVRSMSVRDACLEINDDDRHQITSGGGNATIDIVIQDNPKATEMNNFRGRWVLKSLLSADEHRNSTKNMVLNPLFTPYQPEWCRRRAYKGHEFCKNVGPVRKKVFEEYAFHWNSGQDMVLNQPGLGKLLAHGDVDTVDTTKSNRIEERSHHVCFLGASHSRNFMTSCNEILKKTLQEANRQQLETSPYDHFKCSLVDVQYPEQVNKTVVDSLGEKACTDIVVGLFQWFFGFQNAVPT